MAWDKTQPLVTTKLRLVPSVITPNWQALEEGSVPHEKIMLAERAADPAAVVDRVHIYSKEDATSGFTELYSINSNGNVIQLTKGTLGPLPAAPGLNAVPGRVYFSNSLCIAWNYVVIGAGYTWVPYGTAFGTVYSVQLTTRGDVAGQHDVDTKIFGAPLADRVQVYNPTGVVYAVYVTVIGV